MAGLSLSMFHGLPPSVVKVRADDSPDRCACYLEYPSGSAGASPFPETGRLLAQPPASRAGALLFPSVTVTRPGTLSHPFIAGAKVHRPHVVKVRAGIKQFLAKRIQDRECRDSAKHLGLPLHSDGYVFSGHSSLPDALMKAQGRASRNFNENRNIKGTGHEYQMA